LININFQILKLIPIISPTTKNPIWTASSLFGKNYKIRHTYIRHLVVLGNAVGPVAAALRLLGTERQASTILTAYKSRKTKLGIHFRFNEMNTICWNEPYSYVSGTEIGCLTTGRSYCRLDCSRCGFREQRSHLQYVHDSVQPKSWACTLLMIPLSWCLSDLCHTRPSADLSFRQRLNPSRSSIYWCHSWPSHDSVRSLCSKRQMQRNLHLPDRLRSPTRSFLRTFHAAGSSMSWASHCAHSHNYCRYSRT